MQKDRYNGLYHEIVDEMNSQERVNEQLVTKKHDLLQTTKMEAKGFKTQIVSKKAQNARQEDVKGLKHEKIVSKKAENVSQKDAKTRNNNKKAENARNSDQKSRKCEPKGRKDEK